MSRALLAFRGGIIRSDRGFLRIVRVRCGAGGGCQPRRRDAAALKSPRQFARRARRARRLGRRASCAAMRVGDLRRAGAALSCSCWSGRMARTLTSTPLTPAWPLVDRLNSTLVDYPVTSFTLYTASSLGTFGVGFALLSAAGFDVPALALGGLVGRLSKRPRAPLDLMLAATLSHAVPATNALKLGPLLAPVQAAPKPDAEITPLERRIYAAIQWVEGPINQYGAPYMLVHWASGLTTVSIATACVHGGVDVVALLGRLPFMGDAASLQLVTGSASCIAGAACLNSLSLPARLYLMSWYGRVSCVELERWRAVAIRRLRVEYRQFLRRNPDTPRRLQEPPS